MKRTKWVAAAGILAAAGLAAPMQGTAEELSLEDRVRRLEEQNARGGFISPKGDHLAIGGELETEYVDADFDEAQDASANSHPLVQIDKMVLYPKLTLSEDVFMTGEIEFTPTAGRVEDMYVQFGGLPLESWIQVGLNERFSKANGEFDMANRTTEDYPILGTSWWRDEEYQVVWGGTRKFELGAAPWFKSAGWRLSWGDGLELNERHVTENDTYEVTHDDDQASDTFKDKSEMGAGAVLTFQPMPDYKFDVAGWHFDSNLNADERDRLRNMPGYQVLDLQSNQGRGWVDRSQDRTGIRTTHAWRDLRLTYEYGESTDGKLDRTADYWQASYRFRFDPLWRRYITSVEPLVRMEDYDVHGIPENFTNAETWDRDKMTYAAMVGIAHGTLLKIERYVMHERTGGVHPVTSPRDPDNNEWMLQLEVKF